MLRNIPLKILSLVLAVIFWFFVLSLENNFYKVPFEIPVQVFNISSELALSSPLPNVSITVSSQDSGALRKLSVEDFEAYVDVRAAGAGSHLLTVLVHSKKPQISVMRVDPDEMEIALEPVREKLVAVVLEIEGEPAAGFRVASSRLDRETVALSGAQSLLAKVGKVVALTKLEGAENTLIEKIVEIKVFDSFGAVIEGLSLVGESPKVIFEITEALNARRLGIKAKFSGSPQNGAVTGVTVIPAVVEVRGESDVLGKLEYLETEPVDLGGFNNSGVQTLKTGIILPEGVKLGEGEKREVEVKVEWREF